MSFATKVIHKILPLFKMVRINKPGHKLALVSYVLFPPRPFDFKFFFNVSHNRFLCCYIMCNVLEEMGYEVHVYDYENLDIDYTKSYDIFIGHNKTFHHIANKLDEKCKTVLLTTGCSPHYDNAVLSKRQADVQLLKNTTDAFFSPMTDIGWIEKNFIAADFAFMIGNDTTRMTWPHIPPDRVYFYNNLTNIKFQLKATRNTNFLYLSSNGQLRRGLDLVIQAFKNRSEKVYICGPYQERAFMNHFSKELSENKNIVLKGFVDQTSPEFRSITEDCTFGILPSVSEGQSGSVLTMMSHGLIPVITAENGFSNVDEYGILIEEANIESVNEAVDKAVNLSEEDIKDKRVKLLSQAEKFSTESFASAFRKLLISIAN